MKRSLVLCLGACVFSACLSAMPASASAAKAGKTVAIYNLGGLDEAGLADSVAYFTKNVPLPVRAVTLPVQTSLDAVLQAVDKARAENDGIVIALVSLKKVESMTLADPDHALVVVNIAAVKQASKKPVFINQSILRALATELGVGYSVDIHCVNRRVASPAELENLGGNFSPPALQQVLISAGEHGVNTTLPTRKHSAPAK